MHDAEYFRWLHKTFPNHHARVSKKGRDAALAKRRVEKTAQKFVRFIEALGVWHEQEEERLWQRYLHGEVHSDQRTSG